MDNKTPQTLNEKVDTILMNHLPHIQSRIDIINVKLGILMGAAALILASMVGVWFTLVAERLKQ